MKKKYVFLVCVCALTAGPSMAQVNSNKPEKGALLLEAGLAPFADESVQLREGQLRAVYMTSEKIGLRVGLGFLSEFASNDNGLTGDNWAKSSGSATQLSFTPGLVRFFEGTDKLSPYIGAELILGTESNKSTSEADDFKQVETNSGGPLNRYGLGAFSGFNYYFAKNLYAGVEINVSLQGHSVKRGKTETTIDGAKETIEPPKDRTRNGEFKTACYPLIRLGWSF
ncbi:MAG: hypothetical protein LBJ01_07335 [Tannerella sp.]|nr:hypothetical protein [Tannerella sp.]